MPIQTAQPDATSSNGTAAKTAAGPSASQQTRSQTGAVVFSPMFTIGGWQVTPGHWWYYREMRCNPTIALAIAASTLPVKAASWAFEADDGVPDDRVQFVREQLMPLKRGLIDAACDAIWLGCAPFEVIWKTESGQWEIDRIKPLLQELTTAKLDEFGNLVQVVNGSVTLDPLNFAWFTYDKVGDDPYGRSRLENLRFMYAGWKDSVARMASYVAKNAGIVPQVHYPEGRNPDRNGTYKDNSEHALDVLAGIGRGQGVAIPLIPPPWADDLMQSGKFTGDAASLCAWRISFAESRSGAGSEILEDIKHKEALIARGFLWPERSFTEGTTGTKAEAAVHGDIGLESCEDLNGDIAEFVNQQIVDELLVLNFGPEAKGSVRVCPGPLSDDDKAYFRGIMSQVLAAPGNVDLLMTLTDLDRLMDLAEIPKGQEVVDGNQPTPPPNDPNASPTGADGGQGSDAGNSPSDSPPDPAGPKPPPTGAGAAAMSRAAKLLLGAIVRNRSTGQ